jgi:hypothetical protein
VFTLIEDDFAREEGPTVCSSMTASIGGVVSAGKGRFMLEDGFTREEGPTVCSSMTTSIRGVISTLRYAGSKLGKPPVDETVFSFDNVVAGCRFSADICKFVPVAAVAGGAAAGTGGTATGTGL